MSMKTAKFSDLLVGQYFFLRIADRTSEEVQAQVHAIGLQNVPNPERYDDKVVIPMVKTDARWAKIRYEEGTQVVLMDDDNLVLVPAGEPKAAAGDRLDHFIENPLAMTDFSDALRLIVEKRVAVRRWRWPKADMVFLEHGSHDFQPVPMGADILDVPSDLFDSGDTGTTTRLPNFVHVIDCARVRGWTPTQHDLLAHDWQVARPSDRQEGDQ